MTSKPGWFGQFRGCAVSGLGIGIVGASIVKGAGPNPPSWLALLPFYALGIGFFFLGRIIARRDQRRPSRADASESSNL